MKAVNNVIDYKDILVEELLKPFDKENSNQKRIELLEDWLYHESESNQNVAVEFYDKFKKEKLNK